MAEKLWDGLTSRDIWNFLLLQPTQKVKVKSLKWATVSSSNSCFWNLPLARLTRQKLSSKWLVATASSIRMGATSCLKCFFASKFVLCLLVLAIFGFIARVQCYQPNKKRSRNPWIVSNWVQSHYMTLIIFLGSLAKYGYSDKIYY